MCLYPKLIKNKKFTKTKKNGGNIPHLPYREFNGKLIKDERVLWVPVGCGKCLECMKQRARQWQVRLLEEVKTNNKAVFVTLTFSNESIRKLGRKIDKRLEGYDRDNAIAKLGVRYFLERWRKDKKKSVKHWLVTELGHQGTENIHLHGIIWTEEKDEYIYEKWKYGFTWTNAKAGVTGPKVVNYIIKYVTKIDEKHREYTPIVLCSPGIGKNYTNSYNASTNKYNENKTNESYTTSTGHKINLPIYYRNKIYTDEEKQNLWIEKLNKNIRWVNGIKIDVSNGLDEYYKILQNAQAKNKRLGYGDNIINWERRIYEREQRNMRYMERISHKKQ